MGQVARVSLNGQLDGIRTEFAAPTHGKSNYAISDLFRHALNMARGFALCLFGSRFSTLS